jgi:hypothetical protein
LIQLMEIPSILSDYNAFDLVASNQGAVGDLVSAVASMVCEKILANANIHMKNSEEVITESCEGLYKELLKQCEGSTRAITHTAVISKATVSTRWPGRRVESAVPIQACSSITSLFIASLRLVTSSSNFSSPCTPIQSPPQQPCGREPHVLWVETTRAKCSTRQSCNT